MKNRKQQIKKLQNEILELFRAMNAADNANQPYRASALNSRLQAKRNALRLYREAV